LNRKIGDIKDFNAVDGRLIERMLRQHRQPQAGRDGQTNRLVTFNDHIVAQLHIVLIAVLIQCAAGTTAYLSEQKLGVLQFS
tara:strand:- start:96 stop:341 length:246 start_codon:yes stop_codon:yes gene_type:complete